jgi:hypothetical protein
LLGSLHATVGTKHTRSGLRTFADVLKMVGRRPKVAQGQHATRHYSETLSKEVAHWIRDSLVPLDLGKSVLTPEAKVLTVYGKKSLDVGVLDERGYLVLDVSIKTFNFKDKKTDNYAHNLSGRFYELLGEELEIRRSYKWTTMVALIFFPDDSTIDGKPSRPSSFANAVKWYSKVTIPPESDVGGARFEHVFIGLHDKAGRIYFFDVAQSPPERGPPKASMRLPYEHVLAAIRETVAKRRGLVARDRMPVHDRFRFTKPTV